MSALSHTVELRAAVLDGDWSLRPGNDWLKQVHKIRAHSPSLTVSALWPLTCTGPGDLQSVPMQLLALPCQPVESTVQAKHNQPRQDFKPRPAQIQSCCKRCQQQH